MSSASPSATSEVLPDTLLDFAPIYGLTTSCQSAFFSLAMVDCGIDNQTDFKRIEAAACRSDSEAAERAMQNHVEHTVRLLEGMERQRK
jgi:hypothetical protein